MKERFGHSDDLAGNHRILIDRIDGAEAMIAIGNNHLRIAIPHEEQRRQFCSLTDFPEVLLNMGIADAEQREAGCAENVLSFEADDRISFE